MLPNKQDNKSHNKNRYDKRSNASDFATETPRAASRWLKNVSAFGVTTVLSAGILVACGQMSSAENNAKSNANSNSSSQNSVVKSSRDMLPSDMLGQMQALPQLTKGLGKTGAAVIDPNKPTLIKFWASWCPLCLGTLAETEEWRTDPKFAGLNVVTVASPGHLNEKPMVSSILGMQACKPTILSCQYCLMPQAR